MDRKDRCVRFAGAEWPASCRLLVMFWSCWRRRPSPSRRAQHHNLVSGCPVRARARHPAKHVWAPREAWQDGWLVGTGVGRSGGVGGDRRDEGEKGRGGHVPERGAPLIISPPSPPVRPHVGTTVSTWRPSLPVCLFPQTQHSLSAPRLRRDARPPLPLPPPLLCRSAPDANRQAKVWGRVAKMGAGGERGGEGRAGGRGVPGVYASSRPRSDNWRPTLPLSPPQSAPVLPELTVWPVVCLSLSANRGQRQLPPP